MLTAEFTINFKTPFGGFRCYERLYDIREAKLSLKRSFSADSAILIDSLD